MNFTTPELSTTSPSNNSFVFKDYQQRLTVAIIACTISAIGVPGNTLVILAVTLSKRLQTRTNFFIVNLSCADLLTCFTLPVQAYTVLHDELPLPTRVCKALAVLMWLGVGSSIISLALIAVVRFYVITKPRQTYTQVFRKRNLILLTLLAWLTPLSLMIIPPCFGVGEIGYSVKYKFCMTSSSNKWHDLFSSLNGIVVPIPCLFVIIVCYTRIYLFVRRVSLDVLLLANCGPCEARTATSPRTTLEIALFRRQVTVAKNLFLVVCSYLLCVMPFGVNCSLPSYTYAALPWTFIFFCVTCCINPILYGLKHPQFQEVLCLHLSGPWRRRGAEREPLLRPSRNT
ncbi:putative alpha-1D adrenergic receptor-like [Apostichopus japonicus]|uniref:Putative alpha-1D adrenergic receptor-like n=1 Tax=Stichopus japonicus TaxID=307972 RepID=A0A2G8KNT4_STIJA|nr:putative alpha-1D adrenergic receptor-like [Apostichopus japonicus]